MKKNITPRSSQPHFGSMFTFWEGVIVDRKKGRNIRDILDLYFKKYHEEEH